MFELRDGTRVVIRPIRPDDRAALERGFAELSQHSRYRRFFTEKKRLTSTELDYLTNVDQVDHVALIAATEDESRGLGVARFVRQSQDPTLADAAIVVVDDMQRKGLGTLLLTELAGLARDKGVRGFSAELLGDNEAMRQLVSSLNPDVSFMQQPGGTVRAIIPIASPDEMISSAMKVFLKRVADGAVDLRRMLLK